MKKIFGILAVGLMALSMISCGGKNEPENKDFTIAVDSITGTSAYVKVTPADATQLYFWSVFDAKEVAKMSDDTIRANVSAIIDYYIAYYKAMGQSATVFDFLDKGESSYTFDGLTPETDYTVCVMKFTTDGKPEGEVAKKNFTTTKFEPTGKDNVTLAGEYESYVETEGYYDLNAMSADNKYYIYLSPDVNSMSDNLTIANFADPDYLYFAVGEGEYTIMDLDLKATFANDILTLKGTFVASNGIQYTAEITAEEAQILGGAPKKAARATIKPLQQIRFVKSLK